MPFLELINPSLLVTLILDCNVRFALPFSVPGVPANLINNAIDKFLSIHISLYSKDSARVATDGT